MYLSSNSYATHDQRYSGYTPDYTQSYATTTDYNTVPQEAYSQAQYDDRAYGGYGKSLNFFPK